MKWYWTVSNLVSSCNLTESCQFFFFFFLHSWKGTASSEVTIKTKQAVGYSKDEGSVARTLQE